MKLMQDYTGGRTHQNSVRTGEPTAGPKKLAYDTARLVFGRRTIQLMWFDLIRLRARLRRIGRYRIDPLVRQLHLGSGARHVSGWLNVDAAHSDLDIDFTHRMPWRADSFDVIVSQHVIEHLELFSELLPLLIELNRVLRPGGEVWLSCPDMEKVCRFYIEGRADELVLDRARRDGYSTHGAPAQHIVNDLFHQWGEHKNLFDFEILAWALNRSGFTDIHKVDEAALLARFPDFPARHDDAQTLYVAARASSPDPRRAMASPCVPDARWHARIARRDQGPAPEPRAGRPQ